MLASFAVSDQGPKRSRNEDRYVADDLHQFYAVADGMGGHAGSEKAAQLVVDTVTEFIKLADQPGNLTWPFGYELEKSLENNVLRTAFLLSNLRVYELSRQEGQPLGLGATALAVWVRGEVLNYIHIGDCRLYLHRDSSVTQLTVDHTVVQEQLSRGIITEEEAEHHTLRNIVTRAVGVSERLELDFNRIELTPGDVTLLASDGLGDSLEVSEIQGILSATSPSSAQLEQVVSACRLKGGTDNVTVIMLTVQP